MSLKSKFFVFWNKNQEQKKAIAFKKAIEEKCIIGEDSVIYNKDLLTNCEGDKNSIIIGEHNRIRGELFALPGGKIIIGDYCYIGENSRIWSDSSITIKNKVLISHNVNIFDSLTHPIDSIERHKHFVHIIQEGFPKNANLDRKPVVIEDDAWIACNSIILRGVSIGRGAIVGAGSVVTKDVPPWTIVAGNPSRIIREIPKEEDKTLYWEELV